MEQTREAVTTNLAEQLCWPVARRDEVRVARRLYRKQLLDGVAWLEDVRGKGMASGESSADKVPHVRGVTDVWGSTRNVSTRRRGGRWHRRRARR